MTGPSPTSPLQHAMEVQDPFALEKEGEVSVVADLRAEAQALPSTVSLRQSISLSEPVQPEAADPKKSTGILDRLKNLNPATRLGKAALNAITFSSELVLIPVSLLHVSALLIGSGFYAAKSLLLSDQAEPVRIGRNTTISAKHYAEMKAKASLAFAAMTASVHTLNLLSSLVGTFVDPFRAPASERIPTLAINKFKDVHLAVTGKFKINNVKLIGETLTEITAFAGKINGFFKIFQFELPKAKGGI